MIPAERSGQKIVLPRRPGNSAFAPRQYYYAASKSGVMPSFALDGHSDLRLDAA